MALGTRAKWAIGAVGALGLLALAGARRTDSETDDESPDDQQGAAGPQPRPPSDKPTTRPGSTPSGSPIEPTPIAPSEVLQWNHLAYGPREEREIYVGDVQPGEYDVWLYVYQPNITGGVRFSKTGQKFYGWNDAPPGGAPVARGVVEAMNAGLGVVGVVGEGVAQAYGVPRGVVTAIVRVLQKINDLVPGAIERGRVRYWADWREGKKGDETERARVTAQVRRWRDGNGLESIQGSRRVGIWHWRGTQGELPLLEARKQVQVHPGYRLVNPPIVRLVDKEGTDWKRVVFTMPATEGVPPGERRYTIAVRPRNG